MIRAICQQDIPQCFDVIRKSFATVAEEFGITEEKQSEIYCIFNR